MTAEFDRFWHDGAIDQNFKKIGMSCIAYNGSNNILEECYKRSDGDSHLQAKVIAIFN